MCENRECPGNDRPVGRVRPTPRGEQERPIQIVVAVPVARGRQIQRPRDPPPPPPGPPRNYGPPAPQAGARGRAIQRPRDPPPPPPCQQVGGRPVARIAPQRPPSPIASPPRHDSTFDSSHSGSYRRYNDSSLYGSTPGDSSHGGSGSSGAYVGYQDSSLYETSPGPPPLPPRDYSPPAPAPPCPGANNVCAGGGRPVAQIPPQRRPTPFSPRHNQSDSGSSSGVMFEYTPGDSSFERDFDSTHTSYPSGVSSPYDSIRSGSPGGSGSPGSPGGSGSSGAYAGYQDSSLYENSPGPPPLPPRDYSPPAPAPPCLGANNVSVIDGRPVARIPPQRRAPSPRRRDPTYDSLPSTSSGSRGPIAASSPYSSAYSSSQSGASGASGGSGSSGAYVGFQDSSLYATSPPPSPGRNVAYAAPRNSPRRNQSGSSGQSPIRLVRRCEQMPVGSRGPVATSTPIRNGRLNISLQCNFVDDESNDSSAIDREREPSHLHRTPPSLNSPPRVFGNISNASNIYDEQPPADLSFDPPQHSSLGQESEPSFLHHTPPSLNNSRRIFVDISDQSNIFDEVPPDDLSFDPPQHSSIGQESAPSYLQHTPPSLGSSHRDIGDESDLTEYSTPPYLNLSDEEPPAMLNSCC